MTKIEDILINMEELIFRVADIVVKYSPAARYDMQLVFNEWHSIMKSISEDYQNENRNCK